MTCQLSAKNGVPEFTFEVIDIVKTTGIDWNWHTLSKIADPAIRSFFEKLQQALCGIEIPKGEGSDCDDECEQDIAVRHHVLRIEMSVPPASVDWDESLWLYIYEHIGLWKDRIRNRVCFYTDISNIAQMDDGLSRIFSIIRETSDPAAAEAEITETFAVAPNTAREILEMRIRTLTSLSARSCTAQIAYWTAAEEIFDNLIH